MNGKLPPCILCEWFEGGFGPTTFEQGLNAVMVLLGSKGVMALGPKLYLGKNGPAK